MLFTSLYWWNMVSDYIKHNLIEIVVIWASLKWFIKLKLEQSMGRLFPGDNLWNIPKQGSAQYKIFSVTGYHRLPCLVTKLGYRLPPVTTFGYQARLPVTTRYHVRWPSLVTGYLMWALIYREWDSRPYYSPVSESRWVRHALGQLKRSGRWPNERAV